MQERNATITTKTLSSQAQMITNAVNDRDNETNVKIKENRYKTHTIK